MTLTDPGVPTDAALDAVRPEHVVSIAGDVWQSFLSAELVEHPLGPDAPDLAGRTASGCVHVSGAWAGSVVLEVPAELARSAAETMFMAEPGSLAPDEVGDGLGELTNMVGGNIKSLLPGPSSLSLPFVTEGDSCTVRIPGAVLWHKVALVSSAGPVHISIWKATSA